MVENDGSEQLICDALPVIYLMKQLRWRLRDLFKQSAAPSNFNIMFDKICPFLSHSVTSSVCPRPVFSLQLTLPCLPPWLHLHVGSITFCVSFSLLLTKTDGRPVESGSSQGFSPPGSFSWLLARSGGINWFLFDRAKHFETPLERLVLYK